jgi:hypothetical protein
MFIDTETQAHDIPKFLHDFHFELLQPKKVLEDVRTPFRHF